jgi:uncharacterized protein (DUF1697 family)
LSPRDGHVNIADMGNMFICLLRAVNVGGRKLIMADLRTAAEKAGFADFRTYIQSGTWCSVMTARKRMPRRRSKS